MAAEIFKGIFGKLMESVTIGEDGGIVILDEAKYREADEALSQSILETARDIWDGMGSSEEDMGAIADDLSFGDELGDASHLSEEGEDDLLPVDGDEEFSDLQSGNDELGLGDDNAGLDDELGDFADDEGLDDFEVDAEIGDDLSADLEDAGDVKFDFDTIFADEEGEAADGHDFE